MTLWQLTARGVDYWIGAWSAERALIVWLDSEHCDLTMLFDGFTLVDYGDAESDFAVYRTARGEQPMWAAWERLGRPAGIFACSEWTP